MSLKRGALTVALDPQTVLVFDRAGRLWSFYSQRHHFRRGLNGNILAKWTVGGSRQRRRLERSEADLIVGRAAGIARTLHDHVQFENRSQTAQTARQVLARAAAFDVAAARADVAHYYRVYRPIGILPPDQYLALVLQVTEGCSFNSCTFCTFYRDRPFHIKSPAQLRDHVADVRTYLDDSILLRRGIFMADANALVIPQRQLVPLFDVVNAELDDEQGIFAFLDGFSGRKKSPADYAALAKRGLRRVYIGLESGHDPLLAWVRKPGRADDAVAAVRHIKAGGVNVGVIVMLGLGGERYAESHVHDTIATVNQMGLGRGDLLYLAEFVPAGTPFETQVSDHDLQPLNRSRMQIQREAIIAGLRFGDARPQVATYDIREFVY